MQIHLFGVLAASSLLTGFALARRHARGCPLEPHLAEGESWLAIGLFGGAHLYAVFVDAPHRLAHDPWVVLRIWDGISSFGGLIGITVAALLYCWRRRISAKAFIDVYCRAFPAAWVLGRLGCTWAFDHPGEVTSSALGMQYPGSASIASGIRHNLGLYEAFGAAVIAAYFIHAARRPRPIGWFTKMLIVTYMPMRFALDTLRVGERTYGGLTAAQIGCIILFALGIHLVGKDDRDTGCTERRAVGTSRG